MPARTTLGQDGRLYIRENGRWRAASGLEELQAGTSGLDAFGLGVASVPGQLAQQLHDLQRFGAGGQSATFGPIAPRTPSGPEQAAAGVARFQPGAVMAGQLAPNLATVNPVGIARSLAGAGGSMAERVAARIAQSAPRGPQAGLEMTLGERTGSGLVQRMESAVASQGGFDKLAARRTALYNQAGARMIGQQADAITPEVLARAADDIGAGMDGILGQPFRLSPGLREQLAALPNQGQRVGGLVKRLQELPEEVPGDFVKNLRRQLQDRGRLARGTDDLMAEDYQLATDNLLAEIEAQLPEGGVERWRQLRQQWKNLKLLESLPEVRAGGKITPRQAGQALTREYGTSYVEGRGTADPATNQFMELTRTLSGLKPLPDSGTASRLGPLVGITAGAASGEDVTDATQNAALYGALGYLLPVGLGRASVAAARFIP